MGRKVASDFPKPAPLVLVGFGGELGSPLKSYPAPSLLAPWAGTQDGLGVREEAGGKLFGDFFFFECLSCSR